MASLPMDVRLDTEPRRRRRSAGHPPRGALARAALAVALAGAGLALVPGFRHSRAPVSARRAAADLLESKGLEEMMTYRQMRERRRREASRTWRKESADWSDEEDSDSDFIANLKHGTNLLLNGAKEFPPWKDVRAEHAERGHKWMEKFSIEEIWAQHCVVPYVANDWRSVLDPLERIVDKADMAYAAVRHVKDVLDPSVKFRRAHRFAAQARWAIERRLRRCDRFSRAFLGLLGADENATEGQRRAAALLMILFEQDGVNLQHNGIYRDDPDAFLELQKVRGAVFNISLIWDQNVDRDMESRAYLIRSREELEGLPQWVLEDAAAMARAAGYRATGAEGPWLISTHEAQAGPVLRHGSAALRAVVFENQRRIGFLGGAGKGDNTPMLEQLLQVRRRLANVVGYTSHAEVVFTKTMASPKQAYGLLAKLRKEALPVARYELQELKAFAEAHGGERVASTADLEHFDLDFWRERMLEERLGLKEDYLRQFFPLDAVLEGLFGLVSRLFGVQVVEESSELCWAQGVRFFRVQDAVGARVASFFLDPFRRPGQKRRGFWSSKIQGYSELLGDRHGPRRPAVHFVFDLPEAPALLTHREVVQVFRTFGSGLRELFCRQREGLVAGSLGLEEDVLELPSHFLARWAFEPETLAACSRHVETKDPLPPAALQALAASRTFHRANALLRRCALARIDLEIHSDYDPYSDLQVFDIGKLIEAEYSVVRPRTQDRELCSLPFNTEKAGVFYGDLWSEALAADVFRTFQDAAASGSPDALGEVGARFRREVLAPGGGRAPGSALEAFLGRPPEFAALLRDLHLVDSELREKADAEVEAEVEENQREAISFEEAYPQFEQDEDEDDYAEFEEE
ncbi:unnamed protein product [Effrenium voratum]|uniref:Peptidase M3A/M3B catalytic domain-containing protein n=1 Tax=Effrenium voratum TaxID=2562239 RepID=A0AA36N0K4_9DINO|nr:unnamed protein product [Effrenium voratum]